MSNTIESLFPDLHCTGYEVKSPQTPAYNCIAWAAGESYRWWWPSTASSDAHWPAGVDREETIEAFVRAFKSLGFEVCESSELQPGVEKVALYVDSTRTPTHMARQLETGMWTSKIGKAEDIDHKTLNLLEGNVYGTVIRILRRPRNL
jgi:acetolactate synthase regulatory subunit